ncbi:uncharacterized protein TNCV_2923951 [Trichonephila clavipes]|nr:uncharacterized protein TNCV_2923951 [Trichonephila clavipes]
MTRQKKSSLVSKQKANKRWCSELYSHENDVFRKDKISISKALPERKASCAINHIGSSCAIEQEAALKLWQRSEDNGFQYTTVLSDGDAKTYQYLNTKEVYGPEIKIKKE